MNFKTPQIGSISCLKDLKAALKHPGFNVTPSTHNWANIPPPWLKPAELERFNEAKKLIAEHYERRMKQC